MILSGPLLGQDALSLMPRMVNPREVNRGGLWHCGWYNHATPMAYRIDYDPEAKADLRSLMQERTRVLDAIETQLRHEPAKETRNRKPARPNPYGAWELREMPFRVFYTVDEEQQLVYVVAILKKERERWYRRGQEVRLDE